MAGREIQIELGWPVKALWPNGSRAHYMVESSKKKAARNEAFWATKAVKPLDWMHRGGRIQIDILAHPKSGNAVDKQNLIIGLKAHFDGIADALGVNDKFFEAPTVDFAEPIGGGRIFVTVREQ